MTLISNLFVLEIEVKNIKYSHFKLVFCSPFIVTTSQCWQRKTWIDKTCPGIAMFSRRQQANYFDCRRIIWCSVTYHSRWALTYSVNWKSEGGIIIRHCLVQWKCLPQNELFCVKDWCKRTEAISHPFSVLSRLMSHIYIRMWVCTFIRKKNNSNGLKYMGNTARYTLTDY
jgi:hypothetical protein